MHMNWRVVIAILVSFGCLTLILTQIDLAALLSAMSEIRPLKLFFSVVLALTIPAFCAMRWRTVLCALGTDMRFGQAYSGVMSAWVGNAVLPSKGGDFAKALIYGNEKPKKILLLSVVLERLIDLMVLSFMAMIGAVLAGWYVFASAIAFGILIGLAILSRIYSNGIPAAIKDIMPRRIRDRLIGIHVSVKIQALPQALIWSLGVWFSAVFIFYILFSALGQSVDFTRLVGLIPLALFVGMIPVSISGIGTRDGMLIYLIADFASKESILATGILYTALTYWLPALVGVPFLYLLLNKQKPKISNYEQRK
jgi:glycosyltransferase 2 family protein